jgi:hypothetical protein
MFFFHLGICGRDVKVKRTTQVAEEGKGERRIRKV